MRIAGVDVSGADGRTLVDLLMRIGRDLDLALAHRIERAYSRQVLILALSPEECDLLLDVLDDSESLAELRGKLAQRPRPRPRVTRRL